MFSTKAKQNQKIFLIILLTKTPRKVISRSIIIAKKNEKKREKKNYKIIKKNFITIVKSILSRFEMFIKSSKTKAASKNETSI